MVQVVPTSGMLSEFELLLQVLLFVDKNFVESEGMSCHCLCSRIPLVGFPSHLACGHNQPPESNKMGEEEGGSDFCVIFPLYHGI